jgi:hypothetical protein
MDTREDEAEDLDSHKLKAYYNLPYNQEIPLINFLLRVITNSLMSPSSNLNLMFAYNPASTERGTSHVRVVLIRHSKS